MGGDQFGPENEAGATLFQSAPPHGGRPALAVPGAGWPGFNPRPRMGGDYPSPAHH